MTGGTLFSGIGAPEVALKWVDWKWCAEIEPFPSAVLKCHFPDVSNLGDITKVDWNDVKKNSPVDLIVAGPPCQSFSIAGLRKSLDDPRGNMTLHWLRIIDIMKPKYVLFENVPGMFSAKGNPVKCVYEGLQEIGYSLDIDVLDSRVFGVPQRRRRIFIVGILKEHLDILGNNPKVREALENERSTSDDLFKRIKTNSEWDFVKRQAECLDIIVRHIGYGGTPGKIPIKPEDLSGYIEACRKTRQGNPGEIEGGIGSNSQKDDISPTVTKKWAKGTGGPAGNECQNLVTHPICIQGAGERSLNVNGSGNEVKLEWQTGSIKKTKSKQGDDDSILLSSMTVRRITPLECERLQNFPDGWTLIPYGKQCKPSSDVNRYMAIGNSMTTSVIAWIGSRIKLIDDLINETQRSDKTSRREIGQEPEIH